MTNDWGKRRITGSVWMIFSIKVIVRNKISAVIVIITLIRVAVTLYDQVLEVMSDESCVRRDPCSLRCEL